MSRAVLILASVLACSHQIAQGLMGGVRDPTPGGKIASPVTTRQFTGVPAIGLHLRSNPGFTGTSVGATTSQATPSAVSCQYTT